MSSEALLEELVVSFLFRKNNQKEKYENSNKNQPKVKKEHKAPKVSVTI